MYQTTFDKVKKFILDLITKYIVWIVIVIVLILWWFFPGLLDTIRTIILFWAPVLIIFLSFIIMMTRTGFRTKRDEEQGIYQYDIIITKIELYLVDLIIYLGSLLILVIAYVGNENGITPIDLIEALLFFVAATGVKQIFTKKIIK